MRSADIGFYVGLGHALSRCIFIVVTSFFVLAGVPSVLFSLLLFLFILVWVFHDALLCTYLYKALLSLCL